MNLFTFRFKNSTVLFFILLSNIGKAQIKLSDIWLNYSFYASQNTLEWLNDSTLISYQNGVELYTANKNGIQKLKKNIAIPDTFSISDCTKPMQDSSLLCFMANEESLYRHSKKGLAMVYNTKNDSLLYVSQKKVFNPSFSYDAKYLAYTDENNMYSVELINNQESKITEDGKWNEIINGRADWVHEEEFGFSKAYYWIPNTHKIAYLRYNESEVASYQIELWKENLYPEYYTYKYPKAGMPNAKVTLHVFDLETKVDQEIFETGEEFEYIAKIGVSNLPDEFYYIKTNRLQNKLELVVFNTTSKTEKIIYKDSSDKYVEIPSNIAFISNGCILDSYHNGFKHLLKIQYDTLLIEDLTPVEFDVKNLLRHNEETGSTYFTALYPNTYTQSICMYKNEKLKVLSSAAMWSDITISPNGKLGILTQSNLQTPYTSTLVTLKRLKPILSLETNIAIAEKLKTVNTGKTEFFKVLAPEGHTIQCLKILPPNFDSTKKYPVLMHCYGGPGYQVVTNEWNSFDYFYHQYLAQKNCIVVLADGRGTDGRGGEFRKSTYGQLGNLEHKDQTAVANYLKSKSYVDQKRIGIWGWSFGGYLSTLCLLKSPDIFSCAIAVAPVTNWRFYDNIYTERYMGLPKDNPQGFDQNSPTNYAQNLQGNLLLIHGTADDNVHIQNSYALQNELLKHNKNFEHFYYPNKNHGIFGGTTRYNLYQKMYIFIEKNLLDNGNK